MTSSETLDRVWRHIDCLYQTVRELLEVQRTTVLKIQIRLSVEPEGTARLEFLNESGETVAHFP